MDMRDASLQPSLKKIKVEKKGEDQQHLSVASTQNALVPWVDPQTTLLECMAMETSQTQQLKPIGSQITPGTTGTQWFDGNVVEGDLLADAAYLVCMQFWPREIPEAKRIHNINPLSRSFVRDSADFEVIKKSLAKREPKWVDCIVKITHYAKRKHSKLGETLDDLNGFMNEMKDKSGYSDVERAFVIGGILWSYQVHLCKNQVLKEELQQRSVALSLRRASKCILIFRYCCVYWKLMTSNLSVADFTFYLRGAVRHIRRNPDQL